MIALSRTTESGRLPKLAYTLREASDVLGLSTRTIRRLVNRGLLHPSRASQRFIFSHKELDRFLEQTTYA